MEEITIKQNTEKAFLALLRTSLHGGSPSFPEPVNWLDLFRLASLHNVLPLVLNGAWQNQSIPESLLESVRFSALQSVIAQSQRTAAFLALYRYLSGLGIQPLVLKGLVCRSLYPQPDDRPSNDEDLLIRPKDFNAVHEALLSGGMQCTVSDPSESMHEITYTNGVLRIELHMSCFPEDSEAYGDCNSLFEGIHDRTIEMQADGVKIKTPSYDDHILYLICHAYKHFLHSGIGIRQVCDIGMFSQHYKDRINWPLLGEKCDRIHITRFVTALFMIASKHLGFSMPDVFEDIKTDESDLLKDILAGGVYGAAEENRLHSSTITLEAVAAQKQGRKRSGALSSVFLPLKSMEEKYPYLKKYPFMLPGAWIQRIWTYLFNKNKNTDPFQSMQVGSERVRLLKEYGILD